jgi:hypothetical protein
VGDVENPARQPFQRDIRTNFSDGQASFGASFNVPIGKRLVVEDVSSQITLPAGQGVRSDCATTTAPDGQVVHFLVLASQGTFGSLVTFAANDAMRLYADGGSTVRCEGFRGSGAGLGQAIWTFSGYLVDAP